MKIVQAELFRLAHEKKYYLMLIGGVLLPIFQVIIFVVGVEYLQKIDPSMLNMFRVNGYYEFGFFQLKEIKSLGGMALDEMLISVLGKNGVAVYISVLAAYYTAQYADNIIRYLKIKRYSDSNIFFSMTFVLFLVTNLFFAVYFFAVLFFFGIILQVKGIAFSLTAKTGIFLVFLWLEMNFYVIFLMSVSLYSRRLASALLLDIIVVLSMGQALKFVELVIGKKGALQEYWILSQIESIMTHNVDIADMFIFIMRSFCFAAICFVLNRIRIGRLGRETYY